MNPRARLVLKVAVWIVCLLPLASLVQRFVTDSLGANPISEVTNRLGDSTLRILLASLAMTPLRILLGASWPVLLRRLLGLFAFTYAVLHFLVWILVDHFFNWGQMARDIVKRPYVTVGMLALLLLVPLAATSTSAMIKRLGNVAWRRLHRLAYLIGGLGVLHFLWLAKVGRTDQYLYAAILVLLLTIRATDALVRRVRRRRGAPGGRRITAVAGDVRLG